MFLKRNSDGVNPFDFLNLREKLLLSEKPHCSTISPTDKFVVARSFLASAIRQENKLFFEPFLENKELAFCYWNPMGQNLYDSVPGLVDAVGHRKKWRAVIVNSHNEKSLKMQNPYDVVDYRALSDLKETNPQPEENESFKQW